LVTADRKLLLPVAAGSRSFPHCVAKLQLGNELMEEFSSSKVMKEG
jgi:hypothetical protein